MTKPRAGRSARVTVAVGVAVVLAAAGACTADDDAAAEPTSELDAYLNEIWGDADEDPDVPDPSLIVEQELIATCMAEAGFEYHPDLGNTSYTSPVPLVLTTAYARELGYGYTTEAFGPGEPPDWWRLQSMTDPAMEWNDNYVLALSVDAQEEYRRAMYGPESENPDDLPPLAEQGCWGRAQSEVYTQMPERFDAVDDEIQAMTRTIQEDPRVMAVQPRWADCMADAGYPGLGTIEDGAGVAVDLANAFPAPADMTYDEIRETYPDELAELQQAEVAVAVADTTCREEVGYYDVRAEVEADVEQRIVEMYREDLEAWAAWAQEQRAA